MANPYVAPFDVNFAHQEGYTTYGFFAPMSGSPGANGKPFHPEEVVVTGFPSDVKSRELRNLLRHLPGFQVCMNFCCDEVLILLGFGIDWPCVLGCRTAS